MIWCRTDVITTEMKCTINVMLLMVVCSLSHAIRLFVTLWTVAHQALLSKGFSRQEYWRGLPCPSPGELPDLGIKPGSPVLQAVSCIASGFFYQLSHQVSCFAWVILNHPLTHPVLGKIACAKPVPGTKKVGNHCCKGCLWLHWVPLDNPEYSLYFKVIWLATLISSPPLLLVVM